MHGQQSARRQPAPGDLTAKAGAENFPVALKMLPRRYREHLMAVYRFARTVDDVGDEAPPEQRQQLLADLAEDLDRLYAPQMGHDIGHDIGHDADQESQPRDPAVRGLAKTVAECAIPAQPFRDLIAANQQDQVVFRYQTFADLLGYCELSANPVGRIVLHVFGVSTPDRAGLSDCVCSGLQIVEHLQDVAEDYRAGRIYIPLDDLRSHGCTETDLAGSAASPQLRELIAAEAAKAAALISAGSPLIGQLRGPARAAVAGYVAGGRAALAALARARYDVLAVTAKPSKGRTAAGLVLSLVRGR
ncbi:MAG TPA: squalene synthase HpnC [Streptosporangiaceae bacterium]|jgi:squalene synthase HpnC